MAKKIFNKARVRAAYLELSENGEMPSAKAYDAYRKLHDDMPTEKTVGLNWGNRRDIAGELGLEYNRGRTWSNAEIIKIAQNISENGVLILKNEWNATCKAMYPDGFPAVSTAATRFSNWTGLAIAADLKSRIRWEDEPIAPSSSTSEPIAIRPREPMLNEGFMVDNFKPSKRA